MSEQEPPLVAVQATKALLPQRGAGTLPPGTLLSSPPTGVGGCPSIGRTQARSFARGAREGGPDALGVRPGA